MAPPAAAARGKRAPVKIEPGVAARAPKRSKVIEDAPAMAPTDGAGTSVTPDDAPSNNEIDTASTTFQDMKSRLLALLSQEQYAEGISTTRIEEHLLGRRNNNSQQGGSSTNSKSEIAAKELVVAVSNELLRESRVVLMEGADRQLYYKLVAADTARQFAGLDPSAYLVYQCIEKASTQGAWTKDIRRETRLQPAALQKIFRALEGRKLIKQVKSVNAKAKKLYMLEHLQPSTELTGGVWYSSDLEFDHEFISELRGFLLQCLRRLNNGQGCTISQVLATVEEKKVSKVKLDEDDVEQLMGTLLFDHLVEITETTDGKQVYKAARKIHTACEFKWWSDAVAPDFHFRTIKFEDGVVLDAHEPHYHTA